MGVTRVSSVAKGYDTLGEEFLPGNATPIEHFFHGHARGCYCQPQKRSAGRIKPTFPAREPTKFERGLCPLFRRPLQSVVKTLRGVTKRFISTLSTRSHEMCRSVNGTLCEGQRCSTLVHIYCLEFGSYSHNTHAMVSLASQYVRGIASN